MPDMKLIPLTSCDSTFFNFQPQRQWPESWPPFSWNQKIIAGFTHSCQYALEFKPENEKDHKNFLHLFSTCHPQLSLSELGRILNKWDTKQIPGFSWSDFFAGYNYHQDIHFLKKFFTKLNTTPINFQHWVTEKKLHLNDLRILNCIPDINDLLFMFQWIAEKNISHFHGTKALELTGELLLMGYKKIDILNEQFTEDPSAMVEHIELKRKSNTLSKDQQQKKQLEHTTWPNQVQGQWTRKGDQAGLELKLWCKNQEELQQKLKTLSNLDTLDKVFVKKNT